MQNKPLTLLSSHGGCAAKLGPSELQKIFEGLAAKGVELPSTIMQHEDAGLYQFSQELWILQSIDVITPISDDPFVYGAIAAAHALSDIYAKGAKPITGLLFLGLPILQVPVHIANEIIRGAISKLHEAGAMLLRVGESICLPEYKNSSEHFVYIDYICRVMGDVLLDDVELSDGIWVLPAEALKRDDLTTATRETLSLYRTRATE